jgi:hypothetical protein
VGLYILYNVITNSHKLTSTTDNVMHIAYMHGKCIQGAYRVHGGCKQGAWWMHTGCMESECSLG